MTRVDAIAELFLLRIESLHKDVQENRPRPGECEPEPPERLTRCAQRKADQLQRARDAGLLL